ncbi:unnamed protein product [Brassica napus]|uniref:(rape) hypothetical protein n=1 Tax=Brassica napus TaxID=3708 RepID=A0A816YXQ1_BRANA|nr:unnamed protein product [Brassica napus]
MAHRDAYEDKHILYSQPGRKASCLGMLKGKGVAIPQQAMDAFTEKATILQREAADLEYIDERILAGIDLYGSNLGLIARLRVVCRFQGVLLAISRGRSPNPIRTCMLPFLVDKPTLRPPQTTPFPRTRL